MKIDIPVRDRQTKGTITVLYLDTDIKYNALSSGGFIKNFPNQARDLLDDLTKNIVALMEGHGFKYGYIVEGEDIYISDKTIDWIHKQIRINEK